MNTYITSTANIIYRTVTAISCTFSFINFFLLIITTKLQNCCFIQITLKHVTHFLLSEKCAAMWNHCLQLISFCTHEYWLPLPKNFMEGWHIVLPILCLRSVVPPVTNVRFHKTCYIMHNCTYFGWCWMKPSQVTTFCKKIFALRQL